MQLAGVAFAIFGLVGLAAILHDSTRGEYAKAATVMQIGPLGGTMLSAIAVGIASWIVILGLRMVGGKQPAHLSVATPFWLGGVLANPSGLAHKSCSDARATVAIYLVMAIAITAVSRFLSNSSASLGKSKEQTGQP